MFFSFGNKFLNVIEIKKGFARGGHYHKYQQDQIILFGKVEYREENIFEKKENPLKMLVEFSPRKHKNEMIKLVNLLNKLKKLGFYAYYLKEPRKPIDVKSQSDYEKLVKKPITDFDNLGFSRYDEVDILFVR